MPWQNVEKPGNKQQNQRNKTSGKWHTFLQSKEVTEAVASILSVDQTKASPTNQPVALCSNTRVKETMGSSWHSWLYPPGNKKIFFFTSKSSWNLPLGWNTSFFSGRLMLRTVWKIHWNLNVQIHLGGFHRQKHGPFFLVPKSERRKKKGSHRIGVVRTHMGDIWIVVLDSHQHAQEIRFSYWAGCVPSQGKTWIWRTCRYKIQKGQPKTMQTIQKQYMNIYMYTLYKIY